MNSKFLINTFIIVLIIGLYSCFATDKATNPGSSSQVESTGSSEASGSNDSNTDNASQGQQQTGRYGDTPEDSVACVRNLSLYSEYFRHGNYKLAYSSWQEALEICPNASVNLYIHGRTLLRNRHSNETDPMVRDMLIDSLMWLYDERIERFGREGFVLGRKGVDMYLYRPEKAQKVFELTNRCIEMEKKESRPDVLVINLQTATTLAQAGMKDAVEIFEIYDRAMNILDYNLEHSPDDANVLERTQSQVRSLFQPYYTCETLVKAFTPRFEENPEDIELLEQITYMLDAADCAEENLFYKATKNLHRLKPTASSAFLMGRLEINQNNHRQAVDYFAQAADLYGEKDNNEEQYRAYMLKAEIQYRQQSRHSQARASALKAAQAKPDDGRPYILIGEMYASTAEECGDDDFTKRTAYWAAVDKFIQAKAVDSDSAVIDRADQLIEAYKQYFPDGETIFFHGYEEGDPYRVQCWINETTSVRAR